MSNKAVDPFDLAAGVPALDVAATLEGDLRPKPKASIGMSRNVLGVLVGLAVVFLVMFMAVLDNMEKPAKKAKTEDEKKGIMSGKVPEDIKSDKFGAVPASEMPNSGIGSLTVAGARQVVPGSGVPQTVPSASSVLSGPGKSMQQVPAPAAPTPLTPEEQRVLLLKQQREERMMQARLAGLDAKPFQGSVTGVAGGEAAAGKNDLVATAKARLDALQNKQGSFSGGSSGTSKDMSDQDMKLKFMKEGGTASTTGFHPHTLMPLLSSFQLNAGSYVPSILEMAVNSNLPGFVTARVRENVYDTVSGKCLLIPSGTKLLGSYDSKVALGQARQLVVWNRATFPNGSELNMAGMPSTDVSGQSGLDADVDNHWLRLFGVALGMTAVTAGVQLSLPAQPTSTAGTTAAPSNAQIVSTALTQQFGQLGAQIMGRYLNIQPTLRNYPGERFNIIVPTNVVFPGCYRG